MENNEREGLQRYVNEKLELAKQITQEYINLLDELHQQEINVREKIKIRMEQLKLKINFITLQGMMEAKLKEISRRN